MERLKKVSDYGNDSISMLKGADRVRKRPGVIFGSDDLEGCKHALFEILSNSADEAKAGFGKKIEVTRHADKSITVRDYGRGVPLDWNSKEERYNWELVYTELYSGGKYEDSDSYSFSLGLNGLGACATQCASEWFEVTSVRDGFEYSMRFEKGEPVGELKKVETKSKRTGTTQHWKPDLDVFTDIDIPLASFQEMIKLQSIVNAGVAYVLKDEESGETFEYCYKDGILGYVKELAGEEAITEPYLFDGAGTGRDREDKPEYDVKAEVAFCFSNKVQNIQYFHNSSLLEHGGAPDRAVKSAMVSAFDKEIKQRGKYNSKEAKVTFGDIQDSLIIVVNSFSTRTSYEGQTKKAISSRFIQEFLTSLIRSKMEVWFAEHKAEADKIIEQILINKRSREASESQRITVKRKLMEKTDVTNKVKKFVDCRSKDPKERELLVCLKGDTKVKLLDGTDMPIESLVGRSDLWGYSTDEIGRMIPAKISNVFKTQEVTEMVRIHFDDGSVIESTPEHRFLDKDTLQWKEAQYLLPGESIASMKFRIGTSSGPNNGRLMVWVPEVYESKYAKSRAKQGHWELVHRRTALLLGMSHEYDGKQKMDVHHIDGNKMNNTPSNLVFVTPSEHRAIHNKEWHESGLQKEQFYGMPEESWKRMAEGYTKITPEGKERARAAQRASWEKDRHNPKRTWARYNNSPKFREDIERNKPILSEKMRIRWEEASESEKERLKELNRRGQLNRFRIKAIHMGQELLENGEEINESNWNKLRKRGQLSFSKAVSYFGSEEQFVEEVKNYNLKVVDIEYVHYNTPIPVYCLMIESDFHSFVLENGVITHNCEGDSALGSLLTARDSRYQALMPIRGKILNIQKASLQSVFSSEIIMDLIRVLGCGVEIRGKKLPKDIPPFDREKLKYNKIILYCDQDVDGEHIVCLVTTMIHRLCPQLIEQGYLYYALTPLFEITDRSGKKEKTYYAFSDAERDKILKGKDMKKITVQRSKGLGENDAEMMHEFTAKGTRKLVRVTAEEAEEMEKWFDLFMGNDVAPRREYIEENGHLYMDDLDVS